LADGFYVIEAMVGGGGGEGGKGWRTQDKSMHILPTLKSTSIFKTFAWHKKLGTEKKMTEKTKN
jgi:hypothetical protein